MNAVLFCASSFSNAMHNEIFAGSSMISIIPFVLALLTGICVEERLEKKSATVTPRTSAISHIVEQLTAIIHEAPVLARGAMFEGPLLLDAHR